MNTNTIVILLVCGLVSSTSHASTLHNFCKADLRAPDSPAGYPCLPSDTVTPADFKYSFNGAPPIPVPSDTTLYAASVDQIPTLNGLHISGGRVEMAPGGFLPAHSHGANEILFVIEGEMEVALFTPGKAYQNTLRVGDLVVFPEGLVHYLRNSGKGKAVGLAAYSSARPPFRFQYQELFSNNVPSPTIAQVTFIDVPQVRRNKARFNGTG